MRTIYLLGLGALSGVVATVLLFSLDDPLRDRTPSQVMVGNASMSLTEETLADAARIALAGEHSGPGVEAEIERDGHVVLEVSGNGTTTARGTVVFNPEIREGALTLRVVEGEYAGANKAEVAAYVERALAERLAGLAGARPYRVTAIATAGGRLTIDIDVAID